MNYQREKDDFVSDLIEIDDTEEELPTENIETTSGSGGGGGSLRGYTISLLFDTSYSMIGDKMEDAKSALHKFIDSIDMNQNELALVSFGDGVQLKDGFGGNKSNLKAEVDACQPGGATPLLKALEKSYDNFLAGKSKPVVVLATDGVPTDATKDVILEYGHVLKNENDVWIMSVGIGRNVDTKFLKKLSTEDYYFYAELSEELCGKYEEILDILEQLPSS